MTTHPRHGRAAFTLIELLAVITIMVILFAVIIGGMDYARAKQAQGKAKVQIGLISQALERYKLDNSTYPSTPNSPEGIGNSNILFEKLYFDGANDPTKTKTIYLPELDPATSKQGWTSGTASANTKIEDPWVNEYRYRTAFDATGAANADTQNPDFDLWSGGKDGKTKPSTPADPVNRDDIKN